MQMSAKCQFAMTVHISKQSRSCRDVLLDDFMKNFVSTGLKGQKRLGVQDLEKRELQTAVAPVVLLQISATKTWSLKKQSLHPQSFAVARIFDDQDK